MKVGVDVQVVAEGNRSGLYTCLRAIVREIRPLVHEQLTLFAERRGEVRRMRAGDISGLMDGAPAGLLPRGDMLKRIYVRSPRWRSMDVFLHNLHGGLPRHRRAANAYLVPDVIPLAIDYGSPGILKAYLPFYQDAVRYGDVIFVFSEHAKQDLLDRVGGSPETIRVAPLAAGSEFRPHNKETLRSALEPLGLADAPYLLMVATLERRKNHAVLLRAFAELIRDPAIKHKLVLVGGKWIGHEAVFDLIRELRLTDRVLYLGFSDALPALYAGCDAFVFPSRYEGFGLPALEAMASGVPVLAANATSLPEVVGDAGVLFDPDDIEELRAALHRTIVDRAFHDDLAHRGLCRASAFSWRHTAEQYVDGFELAIRRATDGRNDSARMK